MSISKTISRLLRSHFRRNFHNEKIWWRHHKFRLPRRIDGRSQGPTWHRLDDGQWRRAAYGVGQGGCEDFEGVFTGSEAEARLPTSVEAQTQQQAEAVEFAHGASDA